MGLVHLTVILGCATLALGLVPKCSKIPTVKDFDNDKFTGLWYEITAYMNNFDHCPTIRLGRLANKTFEIKSTACYADNKIILMGNAETNVTTGQFNITYPILMGDKKAPFWLWAIDYTRYFVMGYCRADNIAFVSVFARSPKLNDELKNTVNEKLKSLSTNLDQLRLSKQENCCYDPNSAAAIGFSVALLMSTVIIRLL